MSKKIKNKNLKIILATALLTMPFTFNNVEAMNFKQPYNITPCKNNTYEPKSTKIFNEHSKKLEKMNKKISQISKPRSYSNKEKEKMFKTIDEEFNNLKQKMQNLNLIKKDKEEIENNIELTTEKLDNIKNDFDKFKEENKNKIEITKDMIDLYICEMQKIYENLSKVKITSKDTRNIFFKKEGNNKNRNYISKIRDDHPIKTLYNEFLKLYCIHSIYKDKKLEFKLDFNKLLNSLKELNILKPNPNNKEIYNINPDDYFISKEIINNYIQKLKNIKKLIDQKYEDNISINTNKKNKITEDKIIKNTNYVIKKLDCY